MMYSRSGLAGECRNNLWEINVIVSVIYLIGIDCVIYGTSSGILWKGQKICLFSIGSVRSVFSNIANVFVGKLNILQMGSARLTTRYG